MSRRWIAVPSRIGLAARLATIVLVSAAMAIPGCSGSSQPQDTLQGTAPGASLAPGGQIKPNATPSKGAAKAEPL